MAEPYDPQAIEAKWQRPLGRAGRLPGRQRRPPPAVLRALHVPLPERAGPPGPHPQLHLRRPAGPPADHAGLRRAEPHRLRQLRPAGRERRHQDRHPPPHLHRGPHRGAQGQPEAPGRRLRLAAGDPQPRPAVHALEPGHLPALPGGGPGLPQERPGQLVPRLPDRAGQRAGPARRHLRAQRRPGRSSATSSSGSSASPPTPTSCWTPWTAWTGPSGSRPCSATGSAAPRAPSSTCRSTGGDESIRVFTTRPDTVLRHDLRGAGPRAPPGRRASPPPSTGTRSTAFVERVRSETDIERQSSEGAAGQAGRVHRRLRHQPLHRRSRCRSTWPTTC